MKLRALVFGLLALWSVDASAHEMRPAYLEVIEVAPATYNVLWKEPLRGDARLRLEPRFASKCQNVFPRAARRVSGALVSRWAIRCTDGLAGQRIFIAGLETTLTDVLARVEPLKGSAQTVRLTPSAPAFTVAASAGALAVSGTYLWLGVEHILLGIDHLLFVFALLLIVSGRRRLVVTITAFTVAHSVTLAAATLGWVRVAQQPVEAVIALSILFLASEIVHGLRGQPALTARRPWIVALVFGLLHGLGFASALKEVGLPDQAIPLALLFFNLGVEVGQLIFVAGVLMVAWAARSVTLIPARQGRLALCYAIGSVAALWVFERVSAFWI